MVYIQSGYGWYDGAETVPGSTPRRDGYGAPSGGVILEPAGCA